MFNQGREEENDERLRGTGKGLVDENEDSRSEIGKVARVHSRNGETQGENC